jgi:hypothetical protein
MNKLSLSEHRRISFSFPLVLDAALAFDREHNGWLWRASNHALTIAPVADGSLSIQALRSGASAPETSERNAAWVAAALLNYCFRRRIPIPRQGHKRIELVTDAIELVIATTVQVLPIELQGSALARSTMPPAAPETQPAAAAAALATT